MRFDIGWQVFGPVANKPRRDTAPHFKLRDILGRDRVRTDDRAAADGYAVGNEGCGADECFFADDDGFGEARRIPPPGFGAVDQVRAITHAGEFTDARAIANFDRLRHLDDAIPGEQAPVSDNQTGPFVHFDANTFANAAIVAEFDVTFDVEMAAEKRTPFANFRELAAVLQITPVSCDCVHNILCSAEALFDLPT